MSKLETNTIDNISGSSTLNIGDTNATAVTIDSGVSTVTIPNGAATGQNYPAFEAYQSSSQSGITNNTWTKISANTEKFDTDSMYDSSTNYRFTPTVAGKYFVYGAISVSSQTTFNLYVPNIAIYKNGSSYKQSVMNFNSTYAHNEDWIFISATVELNGSSDYIELYGRGNANTGNIILDCTVLNGSFGAYRIGA